MDFSTIKLQYRQAKLMENAMLKQADIFKDSQSGEMGVIKLVIGIFLLAILAGSLLPTALDSLANGNESGEWPKQETTIYGVLGVLLLVAIVAGIAGLAYKAFE